MGFEKICAKVEKGAPEVLEAAGAATVAEGVTTGPFVVVGIEIERGLLAGVAGPGGPDDFGASLLSPGAGVVEDGVGVSVGFAREGVGCDGSRLGSLGASSGFSVLMGGVTLLLELVTLFWGVSSRQVISEKTYTRRLVLRPWWPKPLHLCCARVGDTYRFSRV